MSLIIAKNKLKGRRGFTLAEILIASIIGTMVIASAWSVYVMVWQWWSEMSPRLEVERFARMTLLNVTEGVTSIRNLGDVAGTYTAGSTTYRRRNGIAWATAYPTISGDGKTITYRLAPDSSNIRQFYYGTYNGKGVIYYKHSNGTNYRLEPTLDSPTDQTSIIFDKLPNPSPPPDDYDNIIQVTVTAEKEVLGTRKGPHKVKVVYTDTVYLRNAL